MEVGGEVTAAGVDVPGGCFEGGGEDVGCPASERGGRTHGIVGVVGEVYEMADQNFLIRSHNG